MGDIRFIAWAGYDFKGTVSVVREYLPTCPPDLESDEQGSLYVEGDAVTLSPSVDASELKPKVTATT